MIDTSTLECDPLNIPPQLILHLTNPDCILSPLPTKGLLNRQNRLKRLHIDLTE